MLGPPRKIVTDMDLGELFKIHLLNVWLTVLTLGIYRFWAKTRLRQYLWAAVRFEGDRLEYTGQAKELLKGFLLAFGVFLVPFYIAVSVNEAVILPASEWAYILIDKGLLLLVLFFTPFALYRARRYRLSRTQWRGIRAGQTGTALGYAKLFFLGGLMVMLTLGLTLPHLRLRCMAYKLNKTVFGNARFDFSCDVKPLYRTYFFVLFMAAFSVPGAWFMTHFILVSTGVWGAYVEIYPPTFWDSALQVFLGLSPYLAGFIAGLFFWSIYKADEYAHFAKHTQFQGCRFRFTAEGMDVFNLWFLNMLTMMVTFTLGAPFVYRRTLLFIEDYLVIHGPLDYDSLAQCLEPVPGRGEGLADAFDVDGF
ncbi:MAG: YjgN family protein [Magnetospiraceae bacterium]